jgi:hypothetical protein
LIDGQRVIESAGAERSQAALGVIFELDGKPRVASALVVLVGQEEDSFQ